MNGSMRIELGRDLQPWEKSILDECDLFLVGGIVRDLLLGLSGTSLDEDYVVVGLDLERLITILDRFGKTNLVGKSFGVIKFATEEGKTVDISLPRTEYSVGPGHRDFKVSFDKSIPIERDLMRRDFTINSMALHLGDMRIVDPLGGREDLDNRILRVNSSNSFQEDPLRILRGIQFLSRFELSVDDRTLEIMKRDGHLLETVSTERVREELNKMLLLSDKPGRGFILMRESGILHYVLPELEETSGVEQNEFHPDDLFMHSVKSCELAVPELHIRWGALLHDLGKKKMKKVVDGRIVFYRHEEESALIAKRVLDRLRFPGDFTRRIVHLVRHHMFHITGEWSDSAVRRFVARVGAENLDDLFALREADALSRGDSEAGENIERTRERIKSILDSDAAFKREHLAVDGSDVIRILEIEPGPEVGRHLQELLEMVLEKPNLNNRETLIEILKNLPKE